MKRQSQRLFYVKDLKTGKRHYLEGAGESPYFDNKMEAKKLRDEVNEKFNTWDRPRYVIAKGVDHIGKHSGYGVPRMRRQPKCQSQREVQYIESI